RGRALARFARVWDPQDNLAQLLAGFEPLVSCRRLGKREDGVDDREGTARCDEVVHRLEVLFRAHRRSVDGELFPPDAVKLSRRVRPARGTADADAPGCARGGEGARPGRLADVVDDDVRAAAGQLFHSGDDVLGVVVERSVRAELTGP